MNRKQREQKKLYEALARIRKPVLIAVATDGNPDSSFKDLDRTRILLPDGRCSYVEEFLQSGEPVEPRHRKFRKSCFAYKDWDYKGGSSRKVKSLKATARDMREFDQDAGLKIVGIVKI